jgi:hypothetical protein
MCASRLVVILVTLSVAWQERAGLQNDESGSAESCPLRVICVVSPLSSSRVTFSIVNTSGQTLAIPKRGMPFRMNSTGATHLVVLHDGSRLPSILEDAYEVGIPMLDDLNHIRIEPGKAYCETAELAAIIGHTSVAGVYDVAGIWCITVQRGAEHKRLSVPIPMFSFAIGGSGSGVVD